MWEYYNTAALYIPKLKIYCLLFDQEQFFNAQFDSSQDYNFVH